MRISIYVAVLLVLLSFNIYANNTVSQDSGLAGFSVSPYLLDVTSDSATVAFHLKRPLSARVIIKDREGVKEFASLKENTSHFIKITGLKSASTYRYEVICGDGEIRTKEFDQSFQIRTACGPGESFTFAVYGDTRPGDTGTTRYHQEVIDQAILHEPVFSLVLGDMVDNGEKIELWEDFFWVESRLLRSTAIYPVIGDNDYAHGAGMFAKFFPELERRYYKFKWGGVYFFGLYAWDTRGQQSRDDIIPQSPQMQWLESELSKEDVQKAPFRVIFLHDPVYISRGRASEAIQQFLLPILQKYKVDVVFASWHMYERSQNEGITYIISGGGGAELIWIEKNPAYSSQAEARRYHFCRVDIQSNTMTIRAIATDGTVLDSIILSPRSQALTFAQGIEHTAKLLGKEIIINEGKNNPEIPLYLFSYDCSYCRRLLKHDLPRLAKESKVAFRVIYFDLGTKEVYNLFLNAGVDFGWQGADVPAIFIGRAVLGGEPEIKAKLAVEIAKFLKNPVQYREKMIVPFIQTYDTVAIREEKFNALTSGVVFLAGLIDGINPCAFTTIILLISYLSLFGRTRRQMFFVGTAFVFAVFATYLVLGLGFLNVARSILKNPFIAKIEFTLLLLFVAVLAGFSTVDFIRCLRGKVTEITLQLPAFLKTKIRQRIRGLATNKITMPLASFVLGVVIAGMELVCTGQVYIPIVNMISEPRYRIIAVTYLFLYNIAFILPLVGVFLLAIFGISSERMGNFFRRHMAMVKFSLALLFVIMALMIIHTLRGL